MSNESGIVSKVWNLANILLDDGVSYGDYLEQLTYLLFLKMVEEFARPPYNREIAVPEGFTWNDLKSRRGAELESHYAKTLRELAGTGGILGQIFHQVTEQNSGPGQTI